MSDIDEKRQQVVDQYRAVAHLASTLATVHSEIGEAITAGPSDDLLDIRGNRSAHIMEVLGDILNGMDAVDDGEDKWMAPIFERAQKMFPGQP